MARQLIAQVVLASALWLGAVAPLATQDSQKPRRVPDFEETQAWFRHVQAHTIGQWDESARAVAGLQPSALRLILADVGLVRQLVEQAAATGEFSVGRRRRVLPLGRLAALMGLSDAELDLPLDLKDLARPDSGTRRTITRVMTRAALLHTQIAASTQAEWSAAGVSMPRLQRLDPAAVRVRDGAASLVPNFDVHWAIAREALELVGPRPEGLPLLQSWYRATSTYLLSARNYAVAVPHLERARAVLPDDAHVFLLCGAVVENLAAPVVQAAAGAGSDVGVGAPGALLETAERYLRRALELQPDLAEARLRLGRVVDRQGRHDEAVEWLAKAETAVEAPALRYFAALYLGRAQEARGRDAEARAAYERAMGLFPRAQSPRLALAAMAWRGGDPANAASGVRTLFVVSQGAGRHADPWWRYDISIVGDVEAALERMRDAAREMVR